MFYFLFHDYGKQALAPAILGILVVFISAFLYLLAAGSSIRRSAGEIPRPRRLLLLRLLTVAATTITVGSLFVLLAGNLAVRATPVPPTAPVSPFLKTLVGAPPQIDGKRLLLFGGAMMMTVFMGNMIVLSQTRTGSALRLWLDRFRAISRPQEEHGSSHFATPQEFRRFRRLTGSGVALYGKFMGDRVGPKKFTYLGDRFCLTAEDAARGMITVGNPGSGKSSSVILPILYDSMRARQNLIVADPQMELTRHIVNYARVTGHRVVIHDPTNPDAPRFNLAQNIHSVSDARAVADVLVPKNSGGGDSFWSQAAEMLLAACLLRFDNLGDIFANFGDLRKLGELLDSVPDDARRLAGSFIQSTRKDAKLANNIAATLSTSLTGWADETIRASTLTSDFDARSLVNPRKPAVIVLACPGKHRRVIAPYLGAVLTRLLLDLDAIGEQSEDGALPVPVRVVLDEFPALGDLSAIVEFANLVRKRRIAFVIAAQTLGQLENVYGRNGAETLLAGMAFQVVFGGCDQRTADYYSRATGTSTQKKTVKQTGEARSQGRALLTPDEIIRPPQGNCTIFGRYVTSEYATYVIVLSRLTRIYEREDVRAAAHGAKKRRVYLLTRRVDLNVKRKREEASSNGHGNSTIALEREREPEIRKQSFIDEPVTPLQVRPLCSREQLEKLRGA